MSHVISGTSAPTAGGRLSRRYRDARLTLSADLTARAASVTGRTDLVVTAVTATEPGAPGVYWQDRAAIDVEARLFEKQPKGRRAPAPANPKLRPAGYGVFLHETAHALHSVWRVPEGTGAAVTAAAMLLEEIRIEQAHVARRHWDRHWLRHSARALILAEAVTAPAADRWATAHTLALVVGRADAGILTGAEADPVLIAARRVLKKDLVAGLRDVWQRATKIADTDAAAMLSVATEWCELLDVDPAGADPSDAQGAATPAQAAAAAALGRAVRIAVKRLASNLATESAPADGQPNPEAKESSDSGGSWDDPHGPVTGRRPATAVEARQAAVLARQLSTAGRRARATVILSSAVPPGRLDMRAVLARDAERAAGAMPTAAPWRRPVRKTVPTPPLRVGIAVDVSSSMGPYTGPAASATWILAQAARRAGLDATSATATFGGRTVTAITKPGQAPAQVIEFAAKSVGHPAAAAIDHLDRALGLSGAAGTRLLVIISDCCWRFDECLAADESIDRLLRAGCAVLRLVPEGRTPAVIAGVQNVPLASPESIGAVIANAAIRALTA